MQGNVTLWDMFPEDERGGDEQLAGYFTAVIYTTSHRTALAAGPNLIVYPVKDHEAGGKRVLWRFGSCPRNRGDAPSGQFRFGGLRKSEKLAAENPSSAT